VERAYRSSTRLLGATLALLGLVMIVTTVSRGGGPLAIGVLVGAMFVLLGCARVYLAGGGGRSQRHEP
jgi:hypothetical protein